MTKLSKKSSKKLKNLVEMVQYHAAQASEINSCLFLQNGESETEQLSYQDLDQRARSIAVYLQRKKLAGKCVLLLYPTGLEFITAFLGCLYAGVIAVPVNCPAVAEFEKSAKMISHIANDAEVVGVLTEIEYIEALDLHCKDLTQNNAIWIASSNDFRKENINRYKFPKLTHQSLTYLQYTSGSTSSSKGVKISHANLTHSLIETGKSWRYSKKSITLTWASHAHVYGLICGILVPLYHGTTAIIIPPAEFIKKPVRWLRLIDKYKVTHSGCPNFGYDVCVQQIKTEDCKNLNLAGWKVAVNGGEAVQHGTLKQFSELVAPFGFNPESFYSSYGMSEAAGLIACKTYSAKQSKDEKSLHSRSDVNLGKVLPGLSVAVIDPEKKIILPDNEIGEICLQGPSITKGYWKKPNETKEAFFAESGKSKKSFLRTGDLGYINQKEIFLTGRLKELLVVHGKKYFPLDLEISSAGAHENLIRKNACIVFSVELNNKEEIIVAQEIKEKGDTQLYEKIVKKIRGAISRDHRIDVHGVILLSANTLPRTSSGKLQRKRCQQHYLNQELSIIFSHYKSSQRKSSNIRPEQNIDTNTQQAHKSESAPDSLKADLIQKISTILRIPPNEVDLEYNLIDYGFDSINIVQLINGLNEEHGLELTPNVLYEHKTLVDFFNFIISQSKKHKEQEGKEDNKLNASKFNPKTNPSESPLKVDLIEKIALLLRIPTHEINLEYNLSEYGFDSITISQIITQLNENHHLNLTPAVFYEYKTLGAFLEFITNKHKENINQPLSGEESTSSSTQKNETTSILESLSFSEVEASFKQDIAIIGISGRFPGADNVEQFWELLDQQKDAITEIPAERWNYEDFPKGGKWGGFIKDVDKFDAPFFNISRHEAELMDPQQRLFLETTWKAIEDAGYAPGSLAGTNTGIYVGVSSSDYAELMQKNNVTEAHSVTGSTYCILANRISYLLDLQGPSMAVDTACSSSLVAIYHAIQAIQNGDCETAIAGGVNLLLTPRLFLAFTDSKMLSEDGHCKTFDDSANGYVRGEGVAAVFLKPLARAVADNDHIYGVIKGSAINHGGRVKSLTVPNPNAQASLISSAIRRTRVPTNTITYVEAHGTGTPLGDPIEINALIKSFNLSAEKQNISLDQKQFCGIGSVKTNIGHLEAAAGIAGVIKVLLAMRNKKLPANIHFNKLNSYIELKNTPFYIVNKTQAWEKLNDANGKPVPYRAGVSSFGFGGLNCHIIIEEAPALQKNYQASLKPCYLIGMSAKNQTALKDKVSELYQWLKRYAPIINIGQLAHTLNVGRDHYENRVAIVADSTIALRDSLDKVLQGQVPKNYVNFLSPAEQEWLTEERLQITYEQVQKHTELTEEQFSSQLIYLAKFYIYGKNIDWKLLHYNETYQKFSLPTYPFVKESYWLKSSLLNSQLAKETIDMFGDNYYVDLAFNNVSTPEKILFKTTISGENFFVKDHIFNNEPVLPGVVYVEIARAAASLAYPNKIVSKIKKITWLRPLIMKDPEAVTLFTHIYVLNNTVRFDIFSEKENITNLHSQGQILFSEDGLPTPEKISLSEISRRMERSYIKEDIYKRMLSLIGFEYRHSFQAIEELYTNKNESLAKVVLPAGMNETLKYVLHPSLLDASIQAMIGLRLESGKHYQFLPFSVEEIVIFKPLTETVYVYGYMSEFKSNSQNQLYDIFLVDENGDLLVKIKRVYARRADNSLNLFQSDKKKTTTLPQQMNFYQFPWRSQSITLLQNEIHGQLSQVKAVIVFSNYQEQYDILHNNLSQHHIVTVQVAFGERYQIIANGKHYMVNPRKFADYLQLLQDLRNINIVPNNIIYLALDDFINKAEQLSTDKLLSQGIYSVFLLTQALLNAKLVKDVHLLYCYQKNDAAPFHGMVSGFAKSLAQENPRYHCQLIEVAGSITMAEVAELIKQEIANTASNGKTLLTRYVRGERQVQIAEPIDIKPDNNFNLKPNSVCVVVGGMGGIGLIVANHLARQYKVRLALVGRSNLNEKSQAELKNLASLTSQVEYIQGDIANKQEAENIIHKIKHRFGSINCIFQSAGITKDSIILKKELSDFEKVLAAKVLGTYYLDQLTQQEPLDYFVLFSSAAGVLGNVGQSDYASANVFLDCFAEWRNQQVVYGRRQGCTVSINWPVWEEGGLQVDEKTKAWMQQAKGMVPITTTTALEAFTRILEQKLEQVVVLTGDSEKIKNLFYTTYPEINLERNSDQFAPVPNQNIILNEIIEDLKILSAELLKADAKTIETNKELSKYGLDSIIMLNMLGRIDKKYNISLLPTAFSEYPTIETLAEHVLNEINQPSVELEKASQSGSFPEGKIESLTQDSMPADQIDYRTIAYAQTSEKRNDMPVRRKIAVISVACRYPKSPTVEAYWDNLINERNLIQTGIPIERWDHSLYYNPDKNAPMKTHANWAGVVDNIDLFDPNFFNISEEDAYTIDPTQRITLELAQELFDRAGYTRKEINGMPISVIIGGGQSEYARNFLSETLVKAAPHHVVNRIDNMIASRISDFYNLTAYSHTMDAACSASLLALHHACNSILIGDAQMAIAGGVECMLDPTMFIGFSKAGTLSDDGFCYVFDERAKGFVMAEGFGLVLLKDYEAAVRDGDRIMATILATATNNDGRTVGLTTPNGRAQKLAMQTALAHCGISPETITYLEAHGTGTLLGDPIEIKAASEVYGGFTNAKNYCAVASVKSNLGHTLRAAGITSVIKVVLALQNKFIPATLHCEKPHPRFKFDQSPFYPITKGQAWSSSFDHPRRAAVSAFAFGGTNVHAILEEYVQPQQAYVRPALPITQFDRRSYWLGKNQNDYKYIIRQIAAKQLDSKSAADILKKKLVLS